MDAFFNPVPWCHEVGEGNHTEIVTDGGSQQGSRFLKSTDTRQYFYFHPAATLAFHFVNQRSHAINSGISRADNAYSLSLFRQLESLFGTCFFTFHSGVYTFGARFQIGFDKLEIVFIADYYIAVLDCLYYSGGYIFG